LLPYVSLGFPACLAALQVERESTDEFVGRMQGYLMLYAAAMQVTHCPAGWPAG
jgi:hypothetical protein